MKQDELRNRLIKLIQDSVDGCATYWAGRIADHLIANGVTVKKFDPVNKCGTCAYYEKIGERMSGYCLKNRYGSDVVCDPKHPYPTVPRSKVKCRHYKEAE